jgi:hypothetical protein
MVPAPTTEIRPMPLTVFKRVAVTHFKHKRILKNLPRMLLFTTGGHEASPLLNGQEETMRQMKEIFRDGQMKAFSVSKVNIKPDRQHSAHNPGRKASCNHYRKKYSQKLYAT